MTEAALHVLARRLADRGYRVTLGPDPGGLFVRNPDLTRPPFVDHRGFLPSRKAERLFPPAAAAHGGRA